MADRRERLGRAARAKTEQLSGRSRSAPAGWPGLASRAVSSPDWLALGPQHVAFQTLARDAAELIHSIHPQAVPGLTLGEQSNNTVGGARADV
jgi:hypothetical protein